MSSLARQPQDDETNFDDLMKALTDNFNILADEVQLLSDRKTILEHKLRFAHEQYQQLADKCAPGNPDISSTLAALQIPPDLHVQTPERATFVPLPSRRPTGSKQQTAEAIRDGRRASQKIAHLRGWVLASESGKSTSGTANSTMRTSRRGTSPTTVLEQDFTVPGKMSKLQCPFASVAGAVKPPDHDELVPDVSKDGKSTSPVRDLTPHQSADPICAAMYSETHSSAPPSVSGSAKCPIRFLDQHSPEEVAKYFETHKHEIPRSHEVCVKRYQRNEDDIRKLDAKYGNIVSMIQGLGAKHQAWLPSSEQNEEGISQDAEQKSNERVENWAKAVSSNGVEGIGDTAVVDTEPDDEEDRESRFDRNLKEIRVGESPSRPWGIAVPYTASQAMEPEEFDRPVSPPPAPVRMPQLIPQAQPAASPDPSPKPTRPAGVCPFGHGASKPEEQEMPKLKTENPEPQIRAERKRDVPTFLPTPNPEVPANAGDSKGKVGAQMVFTGPVFIGYPLDQAMALMQAWQRGANGGA